MDRLVLYFLTNINLYGIYFPDSGPRSLWKTVENCVIDTSYVYVTLWLLIWTFEYQILWN